MSEAYSIVFIKRKFDADGLLAENSDPYIEFPVEVMSEFEGLTMDSPLKDFVAKWKETLGSLASDP